MRKLLQDFGLSLTLAALFLVSWLVQTVAGWFQFVSEQQAHQEEAQAFGPDGYVWPWLQATMENWQSEFLQLFTFVVLTTYLIHRKSHESPDTDYETEASLRRIEAKIDGLEKARKS